MPPRDELVSSFHTMLMRLMTRAVAPIGRVRGLQLVSQLPARLFSRARTRVRIGPNAVFCYPSYDSYWSFCLRARPPYEPGLEKLFRRISGLDFAFIDCGANFGYWSALLTSPEFGAHPCIAVEASEETFDVLRETARLNDDRFACLNEAVTERDGMVRFTAGGMHAGRHIVDGDVESMPVNARRFLAPREHVIEVRATTLDTIARELESDSLLVKLDVEGAEINAIEGATGIAGGDTVFVYEDFGGDRSHRITRGLMGRGFRLYYPHPDGTLTRIRDFDQVTRIKSSPRSGYDFVACGGDGRLTKVIGDYAE